MRVVLIMVRDNGERRSFALSRDVTLIGRREDADFRIPLTNVSRKHCKLIVDGRALLLEDLGSSNGTLHNGVRVKEAELEPGDTIQVGPVKFVVQIDGSPIDGNSAPKAPRTAHPAGSTSGRGLAPPATPPNFDGSSYGGVADAGGATADVSDESLFGIEPEPGR